MAGIRVTVGFVCLWFLALVSIAGVVAFPDTLLLAGLPLGEFCTLLTRRFFRLTPCRGLWATLLFGGGLSDAFLFPVAFEVVAFLAFEGGACCRFELFRLASSSVTLAILTSAKCLLSPLKDLMGDS